MTGGDEAHELYKTKKLPEAVARMRNKYEKLTDGTITVYGMSGTPQLDKENPKRGRPSAAHGRPTNPDSARRVLGAALPALVRRGRRRPDQGAHPPPERHRRQHPDRRARRGLRRRDDLVDEGLHARADEGQPQDLAEVGPPRRVLGEHVAHEPAQVEARAGGQGQL